MFILCVDLFFGVATQTVVSTHLNFHSFFPLPFRSYEKFTLWYFEFLCGTCVIYICAPSSSMLLLLSFLFYFIFHFWQCPNVTNTLIIAFSLSANLNIVHICVICVTIYCILIEFFILPAYNICHSKHSFSIEYYHRSLVWHSKQIVNLICLFHAGSWMSNKLNVMRCRLLFTLYAVSIVCPNVCICELYYCIVCMCCFANVWVACRYATYYCDFICNEFAYKIYAIQYSDLCSNKARTYTAGMNNMCVRTFMQWH